ncbi:hypothetical protein MNBD_BACTEROID03-28 [hydrothermal vent metagenome]|uniref:Uncharacterized protein n=1 Tax=hydrothermal vent metagenome TaxID=652676 RepID=A0A3B0TE21_9ZZZZ
MTERSRNLGSSLVITNPFQNQGAGSYPLPPQGLQLKIRFVASHPPLKSPCFFKASKVYCEQVGE